MWKSCPNWLLNLLYACFCVEGLNTISNESFWTKNDSPYIFYWTPSLVYNFLVPSFVFFLVLPFDWLTILEECTLCTQHLHDMEKKSTCCHYICHVHASLRLYFNLLSSISIHSFPNIQCFMCFFASSSSLVDIAVGRGFPSSWSWIGGVNTNNSFCVIGQASPLTLEVKFPWQNIHSKNTWRVLVRVLITTLRTRYRPYCCHILF